MKSVVKIRLYQTVFSRPGVSQINFADPLVLSGITGSSGGTITWVGTTGFTTNPGSGSVEFAGQPQGVLSQAFPNELQQNEFYNVGFELTGVTAGTVDVYIGAERIGSFSASGVYDVLWHRTGTTDVGGISFVAQKLGGNNFAGSILTSSVSVRLTSEMTKKPIRLVENYVPMGYLDTKEDISLAYNWQLSDAANINKSQGAFFKSFELPGTKNNREVLGLTGEDNLTFDRVDIRNKFRADIVVDDNDFVSGWLVVKAIERDQNEINYQCDFYDSVFGLFDLIQKKKISDIDVSSFDHVVTADNIFKTWEPSRTWNQCYTYPLFHLDGTNGLYTTQDFSPAFYNKFLFNQIILGTNVYGYSISPEADATFSKMLTTPIGKRRTIDSPTDGGGIFVGATADQDFVTPQHDSLGDFLRLTNTRIALNDDVLNGHYDAYNAWDTGQLFFNLTQVGVPHTFEFSIDTNIVSVPHSTNFDDADPQSLITGTFIDPFNYDPSNSLVEVYIDDPNGVRVGQSLQYEFSHFASSATTDVPFVFSGSVTIDDPLPGQYIMRLRVVDNLVWFIGESFGSIDNNFSYQRTVTMNAASSYYRVTPELGAPVGDNAIQRLNKWLPQVTQSEFINETMNFFNMFAFEDLDKTINFITSTELYSDSHVIDWSGKVQWVDSMKPLTDISSSRTILGWKETDDEWNNAYRDDVGDQYGDYTFDNETDLFNEEEENRSRIYGATPMVTDGGGRVVSAIHTRDLPKEHRCILQGDNYYPAGEKISMQYYNPFQTDLWGFEDNYYYEADLGQGYVNNLGFVSSTPSGWEVGDWIVVTQNDDWQYSNDDTYDANYNGLAQILALVEPTPGQYVVVVNKPKPSSTIVIPGRAYRLSSRSVYRSDVHIDSLSASTIDINWGPLEHTLLPFEIELTPNNLGYKYYRNRLIQLRDGYLYTVYVDLSLIDVKELLEHVGGKIWIDSLNSYFTLYSIQDFDVVDNKLTKVELLKVVGTDDFSAVVTAEGNPTTAGNTTGSETVGSIFNPMPGGTYGTINVVTQYGNYIRGGATFIAGTNNNTYNETKNIFVAGDNNTFDYGVRNTIVLGNNQNITESNALYLSNYALFTQTRTTLYNTTTFTNCGMTIDNVFVGASGITIGGLSGVSISSTGITIHGREIGDHTAVQDGVNTYTGGTAAKPTVNVVAGPSFTGVTVGGSTGVTISATAITINGITIGSGSTLPVATDGEMLYNSGGTWVHKNMGIRSSQEWYGYNGFFGYGVPGIISASTDSIIMGGVDQLILSATSAVIVGGEMNTISPFEFDSEGWNLGGGIFGSSFSRLSPMMQVSSIFGGQQHEILTLSGANGNSNTIHGGVANRIVFCNNTDIVGGIGNSFSGFSNGFQFFSGQYSASLGGMYNQGGISDNSVFVGGQYNLMSSTNSALIASSGSTMGGTGCAMIATQYSFLSGPTWSVMLGGRHNMMTGATKSDYSAIIGGQDNTVHGGSFFSGIYGGFGNSFSGTHTSSIISGRQNYMNGAASATIIGGSGNTIYSATNRSEGSVIMGSENCSLNSVRYSSIIAASGITGTDSYTLYTNKVNVQTLVHLNPLSSDPAGGAEGDVYYRSGVGLKFYDGAVWRTVTFT